MPCPAAAHWSFLVSLLLLLNPSSHRALLMSCCNWYHIATLGLLRGKSLTAAALLVCVRTVHFCLWCSACFFCLFVYFGILVYILMISPFWGFIAYGQSPCWWLVSFVFPTTEKSPKCLPLRGWRRCGICLDCSLFRETVQLAHMKLLDSLSSSIGSRESSSGDIATNVFAAIYIRSMSVFETKQGCKWLKWEFPSYPSLFHFSPLLEKMFSNSEATNRQHWPNSVTTSTVQWEFRNETECGVWSFVFRNFQGIAEFPSRINISVY